MQGSTIGVGPALRKARERRGFTIDEASRDTKVRAEFLEALEQEDFEALLGDVHVRGALRTYAQFLGLNPEKVVTAYVDRSSDGGVGPVAQPPAGPLGNPVLSPPNHRFNTRLAVLAAATAIAIAAAFGLLSRSSSAPAPAPLPSQEPSVEVGRQIVVALAAKGDVDYVITADGVAQTGTVHKGEQLSFEAMTELTVELSRGGAVRVIVNGRDLGQPGKAGRPWRETFSFGGDESPAPTPSGSNA